MMLRRVELKKNFFVHLQTEVYAGKESATFRGAIKVTIVNWFERFKCVELREGRLIRDVCFNAGRVNYGR